MDKRRVKNRAYLISDSIISPLGRDTESNMREIMLYNSGVKEVHDASLYGSPFMAARIESESGSGCNNYHCLPEDATILERRSFEVIMRAAENCNSDDAGALLAQTRLIVATTKGNIDLIGTRGDKLKSAAFPGNMATRLSTWLGMFGEPIVISSACISGVNAVITASRLIESGECSNVMVVGADLLSRFVVTGFESFKSISPRICIPYDIARDGLNLGEAVAAILLSSNRELCKDQDPVIVEGGAVTNDANHLSAPSRTGDGLGTAMIMAIEDAGIDNKSVSFINAHGTSTLYNDEMESKAVHFASLQCKPVQSLKPFFGHTLGASGVVETIASAWQMKNSFLFGTRGFKELGVPMEIKVSAHHREKGLFRCIKSASGFGGCNAAIVLALESVSVAKYSEKYTEWRELASYKLEGNNDFDSVIREKYKELDLKDIKFFKMDGLSKLGVIGAANLLKNAMAEVNCNPFKMGMMLANRSSSLDTDLRHQTLINEGDSNASPAVFVYTLPNIVMGEISIRNKFKGENVFYLYDSDKNSDIHSDLLKYAKNSKLEVLISGWCDYFDGKYSMDIKLYKREIYGN